MLHCPRAALRKLLVETSRCRGCERSGMDVTERHFAQRITEAVRKQETPLGDACGTSSHVVCSLNDLFMKAFCGHQLHVAALCKRVRARRVG